MSSHLVFLGDDVTPEALVVVMHFSGLLIHLGQLRLDGHVLRQSSLRGVRHRSAGRRPKVLSRLVYTVNHLLLHSTITQ